MKIFIINLEKSKDRRYTMQNKMDLLSQNPLYSKLHLEYEFFKATDSKSEEFLEYKKFYNPIACYMLHGILLLDTEIACYASHYRLWQECIKRQEPIIVLEDDINFEPHFLQGIQEICKSQFPFVRFYFCKKNIKIKNRIKDSNFFWTLKTTNGTQGYYLTPQAAQKFVAQKIWNGQVDTYMEYVLQHGIDNIIYQPFLISEDGSPTTIGGIRGSGNIKTIPLLYRILQPFYFHYRKLKRAFFKFYYTPPKL